MFLTIHAASGALIGLNTPHPFLAFVLSFISHFVLDLVPHGDETIGENLKKGTLTIKHLGIATSDIFLTILTTLFIIFLNSSSNPISVALGIIGGLLPDLIQMLYLYSRHPWFKNFSDLHQALHYSQGQFQMRLRYGLLFQTVILIFLLFIAL
jgi:hypothetical protein